MRTPLLWLAATLLLVGGPALAVEPLPGDPVAGREFAAQVCAECHQIVGRTAMPEPGGPPAFQDVADHPAVTEMALRAFLQTPHATMPHLRLTPEEKDDVIAYILSLKPE